MKIKAVVSREILDSRGNPTVEVDVITDCGFGRGAAPSGASTGTREALELRDTGDKRFLGKGVRKAVENARKFGKRLIGKDPTKQKEIDAIIAKAAGPNKERIGANATTAMSFAVCAAAAYGCNVPIYRYLNKDARIIPVPLMNIINGGKHAGNQLAIQEFMIIPAGFGKLRDALTAACEIYYTLGSYLEKKYGRTARNVGDEGGYAPPMKTTREALDAITGAIEERGYRGKVFIGIDAAASSFYEKGDYRIDGRTLSPGALLDYYHQLLGEYKIISLEDPFEEDAWKEFAEARRKLKIQIIGDDLFVSNVKYLKKGITMKAANAVLLKVNQIGTLTEAIETAQTAKKAKWNVIVSHRSGETEDTFIADLAVALGCGQIKTGAPARGERTAKYNQLLRIEEELGNKAGYGLGLKGRLI